MPESKARQTAVKKKAEKRKHSAVAAQRKNATLAERLSGSRDWVPWVFVPLGLIGVAWLLVYYIAGSHIGFMVALGAWNFVIGIACIAGAFVVSTFWK